MDPGKASRKRIAVIPGDGIGKEVIPQAVKVTQATGDAVDFVGYQCLKMGHADTAVALLKLNVADNPRSARAHFGLGRALEASGDTAGAISEYRAAVAIDPGYARAQAALDMLIK